MPFARQVSIGRVALVQYPEAEAGKLVVISDVVSPNAVSLGPPQWLHLCSRAMQRAFGAPWRPGSRSTTCSGSGSGDRARRAAPRPWEQPAAAAAAAVRAASVAAALQAAQQHARGRCGAAWHIRQVQHCDGAAGDRRGTAQAGEVHACLHGPWQASSAGPAGGPVAQQLMPATSQQWQLARPSNMLNPESAAACLGRLPGPQPTRTATAPIVPMAAELPASCRSCLLRAAVHPCCLTMLPLPLLCPQALVDFPGQTRRVISFKRLAITDYTVDIPRLAKKAVLKKALEEAGAWLSRGVRAGCCLPLRMWGG